MYLVTSCQRACILSLRHNLFVRKPTIVMGAMGDLGQGVSDWNTEEEIRRHNNKDAETGHPRQRGPPADHQLTLEQHMHSMD